MTGEEAVPPDHDIYGSRKKRDDTMTPEAVMDLVRRGLSYGQIARKFGVKRGTVAGIVYRVYHPREERFRIYPRVRKEEPRKQAVLPNRHYVSELLR